MAATVLASPMPSATVAVDTPTPVHEIPVLIVGAGPVGLLEAVLLTKMGIRVRIIDRERQISPYSRAQGTVSRTLEILAMIEDGFIDKFLAQGKPLEEVHFYYGSHPRCSIPLVRSDASRYAQPLFMEQERLSKVLAKELEEMGVKVEFGWEMVDTEVVEPVGGSKEENYVKTVIRQTAQSEDGECEHQVIQSKYLVAADGGRSTVRHKVNIKFKGQTLSHKNVMLDGVIDTDLDLKDAMSITGVNQKTLLFFAMSENIYRVVLEMHDFTPEEDIDQINRDLTVEDFERHVKECLHPGTKFNVVESRWLTCIRFNERRAENYIYKDRIFLAGDSAHVHSPAGGQGMNTGLQDAYNLAWKLALVLNNLASPRLLQSYEEERMPMADRAIALSSNLLAANSDKGVVRHYVKMLFLTAAPLLVSIMSALPRMVNMLEIKYPANSINLPHKTQAQPKEEVHQVGARAPDGPLLRLGSALTSEDLSSVDNEAVVKQKEQRVYVQELTVGVGKFHILVLVGNCLSDLASFKTREEELAQQMDEYLLQWRTRWHYTLSRDDNIDSQLFKLHVIGTGTMSEFHRNGLLAQRAQGCGKLFWDGSAEVHASYGAPTQSKGWRCATGMDQQGAIVVIRPDSHIGFRVQGVGKSAWADVNEYFQSILI